MRIVHSIEERDCGINLDRMYNFLKIDGFLEDKYKKCIKMKVNLLS